MFRLTLFFAFFFVAMSCTRSHEPADSPPLTDRDAASSADADVAVDAQVVDAARASDGGTPVRDGAPDSAPASDAFVPQTSALSLALSCHLDSASALEAAVRFSACRRDRVGSSTSQVYEHWEAGVFGSWEDTSWLWRGPESNWAFDCDTWRCVADSRSCEGFSTCISDSVERTEQCPPEAEDQPYCDGDQLRSCDFVGGGFHAGVLRFDCSEIGARCVEGACVLGDCVVNSESLGCNGGNLSLCDGAATIDCDAFRPGTQCQSFPIGGELPTSACLATETQGLGAPVACSDGVMSFTSAGGQRIRYDCLSQGFSGCDELGCHY